MRLAFTKSIGPKIFHDLIKIFGNPTNVLENLDEIKKNAKISITPPSIAWIEDEIAKCEKFGSRIILSCDSIYPSLLLETQSPPPLLIVRGDASLLQRDKFAIVGTRNASLHGEKIARDIATNLSKNDFVIVFRISTWN